MTNKISFKNRDIISITDFTREEILYLCKKGKLMRELEKAEKRYSLNQELKNRTLASMFYEPSTRTRTSFDTAIGELGGKHDGFSGIEGTSVMKKETIRDTVKMMEANHFDAIVMRHPMDGSIQWAADVADIPVINGGDGQNEHPTQSLLDLLTLYIFNKGKLDNLNIGFGGDLSFGRTVRSLTLALSHFNNITIRWSAEDFLGMPDDLIKLLRSSKVKVIREKSVRNVIKKVDFYYMTRPQLERMKNISSDEIINMMEKYRIDIDKIENTKIKIMHPLPVNSEVAEIDYKIYFNKCQGFFEQAENGIFLRKALLYEILKHKGYIIYSGKLNPKLEYGINRLKRGTKSTLKEGMFIDNIPNGTVLDHLIPGTAKKIALVLNLEKKGYDSIPAHLLKSEKSFLKTNLMQLTERELKELALISPEHTVNYIRKGNVSSKFTYLLCKNENCITRVIIEDVPPKFYREGKVIRCRYCRNSYSLTHIKTQKKEKEDFINSLPQAID